ATAGFFLGAVVVVVDEEVLDELVVDEAVALARRSSPPAVVVVVAERPAVVVVVAERPVVVVVAVVVVVVPELPAAAAGRVPVATRRGRGPYWLSMASSSTSRASPTARSWARRAPSARISSDRTGPPSPLSRSWSATSGRHGPQPPPAPARRTSTAADSLPRQRAPRWEIGERLVSTAPAGPGAAGPAAAATRAAPGEPGPPSGMPAGRAAKRVRGVPWAIRIGASTAPVARAATTAARTAPDAEGRGRRLMRSLSRHDGGASDS